MLDWIEGKRNHILLSHQIIDFRVKYNPNSSINISIHAPSAIALVRAQYSTSVMDLNVVCCFLVHQEIMLLPR